MSAILAEWVSSGIGLTTPVAPAELDSAFKSGYLISELLTRLDVVAANEVGVFSRSESIEASIRNFTAIEKILRERLDLRISSNFAFDVITGKPGCAAKLLYQIKASLAPKTKGGPGGVGSEKIAGARREPNDHKLPPMNFKGLTGKEDYYKEVNDGLVSYPASPTGTNVSVTKFMTGSSPKKKYNDKEHEFFSDMLRTKLRRSHQAGYKKLDHPKLEHPEFDYDKLISKRKQQKDAERKALSSAGGRNTVKVIGPLQPIHRDDDRALTSALPGKKGVPTTQFDLAHMIREQAKHENKAKQMEPDGGFCTNQKFLAVRGSMDPVSHTKVLAKLLPHAEESMKQTKDYVDKIRTKKIEEEASRKERDQRRRKIILGQQSAQEETEKSHLEELLLTKLMRQSKQERRIAEGLMQVRHQKEVMRENRIFRDQQYGKRRQKDYEEALQREHELAERAREEYRQQTELQLAQHREILARKAAEKHQKHTKVCAGIVDQILDLSLKVCFYIFKSFLQDKDIRLSLAERWNDAPRKLIREWKTLFINGEPLLRSYNMDFDKDKIRSCGDDDNAANNPETSSDLALHSDISNGVNLLDQQEFQDYLSGSGDWVYMDSTTSEKPIVNELLGQIINNILEMTSPPEPTNELPQLPSVPLRICLIGKNFAGKQSAARKLASMYGLSILSIDALVRNLLGENIFNFQSDATEKEKVKTESASQKRNAPNSAVGSKIQVSMLEGAYADDALLVSLVIEGIKKCTTDGKSQSGGWVLVDFPRTRAQAQLLERELSGYEDPKPVKLGNLKRTPKEKEKPSSRKRSMIAPVENKSDSKTPTAISGIDAVFLLDVDNETAIKRAAGRRLDPVTGLKYHLELNPPPTDVAGIHERLATLEDDGSQASQLQFQIAAFEEQEESIKEWYSRFQNMRILDASADAETVLQVLQGECQDLIAFKQREKEKQNEEADPTKKASANKEDSLPATTEETTSQTLSPSQPSATNTTPSTDPNADKKGVSNGKAAPTTSAGAAGAAAVAAVAAVTEDDKKGKQQPPGSGSTKPRVSSAKGAAGADKGNSRATSAADAKLKTADIKRTMTPAIGISEKTIEGVPLQVVESSAETTQPPLIRNVTADGKKLPSRELADILADQWATIEKTYTDTIKYGFRCLRRERETIVRYFYNTKVNFKKFLERPDKKQALVDLFQLEFNAIEDDLRSDPDAKAELHQRAEDLRERLWEMSDVRRDEAEAERVAVIEDKFVEDHFAILMNVYITMVQAEDAYGTSAIVDGVRPPIKVPLLSIGSTPPIDLAAILIGAGNASNADSGSGTAPNHRSRRDISSAKSGRGAPTQQNTAAAIGKDATAAGLNVAAGGVGGGGPLAKKLSMAAVPKLPGPPSAATATTVAAGVPAALGGSGGGDGKGHLGSVADKDHSYMDVDASIFADFETSLTVALTVLNNFVTHQPEEPVQQEKDKKDKKKGAVNEVVEPKIDAILKSRLDRIRTHAVDHLKELRNKGIEAYVLLDEWIGTRFQSEMDAIREMLYVIKEAVEMEVRLPNELVLEGEKFRVDFGVLTFEPEPEPDRRVPPDQFTVLQLLNLGRHFRELAPQGSISTKEFVDGMQRLITLSAGTELLPEYYLTAEQSQLQQIASTLDPNAHMLPVPSVEYLGYLRQAYACSESYQSGRISKSDFIRIPLWFEEDAEDLTGNSGGAAAVSSAVSAALMEEVSGGTSAPSSSNGATTASTTGAKFNRPWKLKNALFRLSAVGEEEDRTPIIPFDEQPVSEDPPHESTPNLDDDWRMGSMIALDAGMNGVKFLGEHEKVGDEGWVFDVGAFLVGCCLDESAKVGLQKAFSVVTEREDGGVTVGQLYQIFHNSLVLVDETHRDALLRVFEDAGLTPDDSITFDAFVAATDSPALLACPLFALEDVSILATRSRPPSSFGAFLK
ncbi:hypothetical protein BC829DRAFT_400872 [Chytridium lagenaria]|nr:hypothetical protein BC829DRAFT_400872 [Chytridium lagenaria]